MNASTLINAEESFIGCLLINREIPPDIDLKPVDFYHAPCQVIYEACLNLKKRGSGLDQIVVGNELNSTGKLAVAGGVAYLSHCIAIVPTSLNVNEYAEIISTASVNRQIESLGKQAETVANVEGNVNEKLEQLDSMVLSLRRRVSPPTLLTPMDRAKLIDKRYDILAASEAPLALSTGLKKLDKYLGGGFYDGDFVIVAGRPGMGKTNFLLQLANTMSLKKPVLVASAEMPITSISDRDVAQIAGVPINVIRAGKYDDSLYAKVKDAVGRLSERQVYFYWEKNMTTSKILQAALGMQARYGLGALFIDYLGILWDDMGKSAYERVSHVSRSVNQMKLILNVPVVSAHQLSREPENRESDHRPQLSHLRDSGSLEQDADVVLLLYRENYYDKESTDTVVEVDIAKQRQGDTGVVRVGYDKEHHRYVDLYEGDKKLI